MNNIVTIVMIKIKISIVNIVKITNQMHFFGELLNIVKIRNITTLHWPKVAHMVTLLGLHDCHLLLPGADQGPTEQTGPGALLTTDYATTGEAVTNQGVLDCLGSVTVTQGDGAQYLAFTGMSPWQLEHVGLLALFGVEWHVLALL